MNRRNPRTVTNPRRASRAYGRRMAPDAPGADRIASRERLARRDRAERIARMRKRAQEREEEEMEETTDEEEEREARIRSARRRRIQAQLKRDKAERTKGEDQSNRSAKAPIERKQRVSKIDALTDRLDRIATLLEKQAEADPLEKPTQDLDRELDDSLRPEELEVGEINEQPVTEEEGLAEEVDGDEVINTKPVSSRVRPIRMAHRTGGSDMDLF